MIQTGSKAGISYKVEVWTQPWWRYAIAVAYHWYDMKIFKVPGFKKLEVLLQRRHGPDWTYLPLSAQQDERCYFLTNRERVVLAEFPVPEGSAAVQIFWPNTRKV